MFQDALIVPARHMRTTAAALPLAALVHGVVALLLVVIPLLQVGALPKFELTAVLLATPPPVPLPAPPKGHPSAQKAGTRIKPVAVKGTAHANFLIAPVSIPTAIGDEPIDAGGRREGIEGGVDFGDAADLNKNPAGYPPGWLVVVPGDDNAGPVRALGGVKPPKLVRRVQPDYPELARLSRVEGIVILEATTDVSGRVAGVKVLKSIPLLDSAAADAVRQWLYEPLVVNGRPRGVTFTVTVRFELKQ